MRDTFVKRLSEHAAKDPRIMLITGDLGFAVLTDYWQRFPKQFLNAGVAEQNMTGMAAGMALEGMIAFTYSIANFTTLRCLEQIRNDAAYHDANVKVVSVGGGFSYGAMGVSHHATEDLAIMRSLPSVTVVAPGDLWETAEATSALIAHPGTCYLRLDKTMTTNTARPGEIFILGKARRLREGSDITVITTGGILEESLKAAALLSEIGIEVRLVSMHTLKPLDTEEIVRAALETGGIVTLEEHTIHGGLGGAVAEALLDAGVMPKAFYRMGLRSGFSSIVGSQAYLRQRYEMDANAVAERVKTMLKHGV